ncbi:hypothetical protein GCM10022215_07170 [Nocardioides fonticola]|uniref:Uncharacterized protein n=1 Tax=Nocardioides fonticola TaxID=450363 RepID=A0ABP7XCC7_9ACTN
MRLTRPSSTARRPFLPWVAAAVALLLLLGAGVAGVLRLRSDGDGDVSAGGACARGYQPVEDAVREVRAEMRAEGEGEEAGEEAEREREEAEHEGEEGEHEEESEFVREVTRELPMLRGVDPDTWDSLCVVSKRPESLQELNTMFETRAMPRLAPYGVYRDGAAVAAAREAAALRPGSVAGTRGRAALYGKGPLIVDDPDYTEVNGLGLSRNMGRIDSYAWDPKAQRLWAAAGNGGIWRSDDLAGHWRSASGNLPTSVTGAVAWTPSRGGTVLALTGEPTFGSNAYTGVGAYWSKDLGRHWKRSKGLPSGALGFALAVDPHRTSTVYAATQYGLFVSTDAGRSYRNVKLPTGTCAGVTDMTKRPECALANVVTDVVVVAPGGVDTATKAGTVVATVGWRGGQRTNADGSVQSPNNGVYRSTTGRPGSFRKLAVTGFAPQANIGRVELGNAVGPEQDHDVLYALVQDAKLLNEGGLAGIDLPEGSPASPVGTTVLNGLYVSTDFGATWTELVSGTELVADPTTGSALIGTGTATGYQPGVQGWYNQWVQPDPTRATASGAPTRLAFGLEEIWTNDAAQAGLPLDGSVPVHFGVVGKYFGGNSCLLLSAGLPACPTDRDPTDDNSTTHPDQQDGIWIPDADVDGGVQLVVGNDGGAYRYRFEDDSDGELDNAHWGKGDQTGFSTLMPYFASIANDGTVYAGLQDNGNLKIDAKTRKQYETYGGDGFFTAVDPFDSDTAYEEYTNAAISVTTDGGKSWASIDPGLTASKFVNPFVMDPLDAKHLVTAGREVVETLNGPSTTSGMTAADAADGSTTTWLKVFDLGTRSQPGVAGATSSATDPDNSMSAVATRGNATYVAYCGQCDTLNRLAPSKTVFRNGIATNVGGKQSPKAGTSRGWHVVRTKGLPNRYITDLAIDPASPRTVYATLGGYTRRWVPAGAVGDVNKQVGRGHLFVSRDAGRTWRDITGNLPDAPATSITLRKGQLLVGTDVGAFATDQTGTRSVSPRFARLGGLPPAPVASIELKPNDPNTAVLAMFGRDVWSYRFADRVKVATPTQDDVSVPAIGRTAASYDFEAGAQGWTASTGLFTWSLGTPGHGSGTKEDAAGQAFALSGPLAYQDSVDATLTSPSVKLPAGRGVLQWSMRVDTEAGLDVVKVEVSDDGGTSWRPIGSYSGTNPDSPGWTRYRALVPAGGPLQVRFHFTSDSLCSALGGPLCAETGGYDGVHVDDVALGVAR